MDDTRTYTHIHSGLMTRMEWRANIQSAKCHIDVEVKEMRNRDPGTAVTDGETDVREVHTRSHGAHPVSDEVIVSR